MNDSLIIEGPKAIFFTGQAEVVDPTHETAWAAPHVSVRPDWGWVLGRFVESNQANENGHIFELEDLRAAYGSIVHAPLNMLHRAHHVVGTFTAAEMLYPTGDGSAATAAQIVAERADLGVDEAIARALEEARALSPVANPYVESLAAFWKYVFPDEYRAVMDAHKQGSCWYSMECVPEQLRCPRCPEDAAVYAYAGPRSESYCAHLNEHAAPRSLVKPHFVGGAMVIPPVMPGWKKADIKQVANQLLDEHENDDDAQRMYESVAAQASHLEPKQWEFVMAMLLGGAFGPVPEIKRTATELARDYPIEQRKKMADKGEALPDGSFPIKTAADLRNAIKLWGNASNKAAAKRHIIKRARALGLTAELPEGWGPREKASHTAQATPKDVVAAYEAHLAEHDMDEAGEITTSRAPFAGGDLWLVKDGWGEWFFVRDSAGVRWVAQKWADVQAFHCADEIGLTKDDVKKLGWGDDAWVSAIVDRLASGPATAAAGMEMPTAKGGILSPHTTPVHDGDWDHNRARAALESNDVDAFKMAFAWYDAAGSDLPEAKDSWKFIHHDVAADGTVGAANITALRNGIGYLNGARSGTNIPVADHQGVWEHLASHLRDAKLDPPPLK